MKSIRAHFCSEYLVKQFRSTEASKQDLQESSGSWLLWGWGLIHWDLVLALVSSLMKPVGRKLTLMMQPTYFKRPNFYFQSQWAQFPAAAQRGVADCLQTGWCLPCKLQASAANCDQQEVFGAAASVQPVSPGNSLQEPLLEQQGVIRGVVGWSLNHCPPKSLDPSVLKLMLISVSQFGLEVITTKLLAFNN